MSAAILGSICQTIIPLIAREIVDDVILRHRSALWPWLVLLGALAVLSFWAAHVRRYRGGQVALEVQYDLRNEMHDHLQVMDFDNLGRMPTGQLVARANSQRLDARPRVAQLFSDHELANILLMLMSLGVMIYLSPQLAVVSIVLAPSLVIVSYRMRRGFPATWDGQQREGEVIIRQTSTAFVWSRPSAKSSASASLSPPRALTDPRCVRTDCKSRYQPLLEAIPTFAPGRHPRPRRMDGTAPRDHARGHLQSPRT